MSDTKLIEVSQSDLKYTVRFFKQNSVIVIDLEKLGSANPGHNMKRSVYEPREYMTGYCETFLRQETQIKLITCLEQ